MIVADYFLSLEHLIDTVLVLTEVQMLPSWLFDLERDTAIVHLVSYFQKRAMLTDSASETL